MSYSFTVPPTMKHDLADAIATAGTPAIAAMGEQFQEAGAEHIAAIRRAAQEVAEKFGRPEDLVAITVSGHANPGHAPLAGWSNESISLSFSLTVAEPPAEPEPEPDAEVSPTA